MYLLYCEQYIRYTYFTMGQAYTCTYLYYCGLKYLPSTHGTSIRWLNFREDAQGIESLHSFTVVGKS